MKKLLLVCLLLFCLLPAAFAETQEEFELSCMYKTKSGSNVHDLTRMTYNLNSLDDLPDNECVIDYLPAGTYVQNISTGGSGNQWHWVEYMKNGVKGKGWIKTGLQRCASLVRMSDGYQHPVHEKDPDYNIKIQQGQLEFDMNQFEDPMDPAYAEWLQQQPFYNNNTEKASSSKSTSQKKPAATAAPIPENAPKAIIYAPKTGKCSLRAAARENAGVIRACKAGHLAYILEKGSKYTKIQYSGAEGYVLTACLRALPEGEGQPATVIYSAEKPHVKTDINIRAGAGKDCAVIAEWPTGTPVIAYESADGWQFISDGESYGYIRIQYLQMKEGESK